MSAETCTIPSRTQTYHINTRDPHEIDYWSRALGVSPDELNSIIHAVGDSEDKVRQYLASKPRR